MELTLPGDEHPARQELRAWLAAHPSPNGRTLAEAGYVAPHWPRPWGLGADPVTQLVIDDELRRRHVQRPVNMIGIGWAGPTILHAGTAAQKERYLMPLLAGDEIWCQLFSEPGAGSDLAGLSTRAVADGDTFVVRGQKIWTSFAHLAAFGILLARTDIHAPKHEGISYFICPMDAPGITIRPIVDMTGMHSFNEVFLDDVRLSAENLVGELHKGWALAKVTLANERVSLSSGGALWGNGPTARDIVEMVRGGGGVAGPALRQRLAKVYTEGEVLRWIGLRQVSAAIAGRQPGAESSVKKALGDEHGQHLLEFVKDLAGAGGMLRDANVLAHAPKLLRDSAALDYAYAFSAALTIGGGTAEVQRNIIAERTLGLPKEIDVDASVAWSETGQSGGGRRSTG